MANCDINQQEAFLSLISLEDSVNILNDACLVINRYLKNFIEIREDVINQPQEYFNYLHSKFELLSGGFGTPTRIFATANTELKTSIRNLNLFIHRVETKRKGYPSLYINFNKDQYRRKDLAELDYNNFEFNCPPGTLFLHYAELGKEFVDLYEDGLPVDYIGFSNSYHYSGECYLMMDEYNPMGDRGYYNWLVNQGIDPYNKRLGHGKIPLGTVDDVVDVRNKLTKYQYVNSITINE